MEATKGNLITRLNPDFLEAGCDEAGRGCLAGPVFAAAVVFPADLSIEGLTDSKKLSEKERYRLRPIIEKEAISWAIAIVDNNEIDKINILNASILAMHKALDKLSVIPEYIVVDGNRFKKYKSIPHTCVVKGDGKILSIAAASVLAKTYRDDFMMQIHNEFPVYNWNENKGYPTLFHRNAIIESGITKYHRLSFQLTDPQLKLEF